MIWKIDDIPGRNNQVLALRTGIRIQEVRHEEETYLARDVPQFLVLLERRRKRQQEQYKPRDPHFEEHLHIDPLEQARVELRAHKEVIDMRARHAVLGAARESRDVGYYRDEIPRRNGDGHYRAKVCYEGCEAEEAREVEGQGEGDGSEPAPDGGAVVGELSAVEVGEGFADAVDAWEVEVCEPFEGEE